MHALFEIRRLIPDEGAKPKQRVLAPILFEGGKLGIWRQGIIEQWRFSLVPRPGEAKCSIGVDPRVDMIVVALQSSKVARAQHLTASQWRSVPAHGKMSATVIEKACGRSR